MATIQLIVGNPASLNSSDTWLQGLLVAEGHTVNLINDDDAENVSGVDGVVISESCHSPSLASGSKYKTVSIPVICCEERHLDTLELAINSDAAGGYSGTVNVIDDGILSGTPTSGNPYTVSTGSYAAVEITNLSSDAEVLAQKNGTTKAVVWKYDSGDTGTNLYVLPGDRVALFPCANTSFATGVTAGGESIVSNVFQWAFEANELLDMSVGATTTTGGTMTLRAPVLSEPQSTWHNSHWWKVPTYLTGKWFAIPVSYSTLLIAGTSTTTGGTMTFSSTTEDFVVDMVAGSVVTTGGLMTSSIPLAMTAGSVVTTGGSITFQYEYTSTYIISNDSTFDGFGINYGTDIAYNSSTGIAYTVVSRVDVDSLLLDGIFGIPSQPYQIRKYIGEMTLPSLTILEYDGAEWKVESQTRLGL